MRPRIHFYSDCDFFAGCENMLANFFNHAEFMARYRISFAYDYTEAYEAGFKRRVPVEMDARPLRLLDHRPLSFLAAKVSFKPLSWLLQSVSNVLKYLYVALNIPILYRSFARQGIDLLHINNGGYPASYSCLSAVFAARLAGIKSIVFVVNNQAADYAHPFRWLDYPLDRLVRRLVTTFVTGSHSAGQRLQEVLKLAPRQFQCLHNGIQPRPVTEDREAVLKRLGMPEQGVFVGVVAILEKRKGHIHLLEAMKILKEQHESGLLTLLVEGDGPEKENLRQFIAEAGLTNVHLIGNESRIFDFMAALDVIALPSIGNEDFPNVILEAMALGKPVIATRIAGVPEQVDSNVTGLLVEPANPLELAAGLRLLAGDAELRRTLGGHARGKFEANFTVETAVSRYMALYDRIINEGGAQAT